MRFLIKVCMPVEKFNAAVLDGTANQKMKTALEAMKPEAAYFYDEGGQRTGMLVVNFDKASQIPSLAEPWFLYFNAAVHFHPCMTPEDLAAAGLDQLGKKYR
jgi:hypothetical protein